MGITLSVAGVFFIMLLVLKFTGFVTWSWWIITAPLWLSAIVAISVGVFLFFALVLPYLTNRGTL